MITWIYHLTLKICKEWYNVTCMHHAPCLYYNKHIGWVLYISLNKGMGSGSHRRIQPGYSFPIANLRYVAQCLQIYGTKQTMGHKYTTILNFRNVYSSSILWFLCWTLSWTFVDMGHLNVRMHIKSTGTVFM